MATIEPVQLAYEKLCNAVHYLVTEFEYETDEDEDEAYAEFQNIKTAATELYNIIHEQFDLIESYQNEIKELEQVVENLMG